jgi:hypothetical protein
MKAHKLLMENLKGRDHFRKIRNFIVYPHVCRHETNYSLSASLVVMIIIHNVCHHHHMALQPKSGPGLLFLEFLNNKLFMGLDC